jgi:hypothetical protein
MIENRRGRMRGAIDGKLVALIGLVLLVISMSGVAAWAYMNYQQQKTNVDSKIALAVATAKKEQADSDEAKFAEREKEPNREFAGPDDYGRVTFKYPKTWSVYVATDATTGGGKYTAYLNPIVVPPVAGSVTQQYALRVTIEQTAYDKEIASYKVLIQKGDLKSQPVSANGHDGTRLDGSFSKNIRGAAVLFKIRDKTVTIQTDADTFKPDFENIIKTIDFND